jgi:hypothetical protein
MKVTMAISMLRNFITKGKKIFMSALQGNTFDREYTAEVSADG